MSEYLESERKHQTFSKVKRCKRSLQHLEFGRERWFFLTCHPACTEVNWLG